jgi:DNA-binding transcriptional LysR family regulator
MLHNFDSTKMRLLLIMAQTHGVTETANQLNITPSAVSQSIRQLEKELGTQLFIRIGKKLKPTPFTLDLCQIGTLFFDSLDILLNSELKSDLGGKLRIGAPTEFGTNWLVPRIAEFVKLYPNIQIALTLQHTKQLLDRLLDYKLDLAFVDSGPYLDPYTQVSFKPIIEEELVLCCSKTFDQEHGSIKSELKSLATLPHIPSYEGKDAVFKWYLHHFGKKPNYPYNLTADIAPAIKSAILSGLGLGVLPKQMIEQELRKKQVVLFKGKKAPLINRVLCSQLNEKIPSKLEKMFVQFCQEHKSGA